MRSFILPIVVAAVLSTTAVDAMAQVTTTSTVNQFGSTTSRTVHRGNMTVTRVSRRGRFGFHGCDTVTSTRRTAFGVTRSSRRSCH